MILRSYKQTNREKAYATDATRIFHVAFPEDFLQDLFLVPDVFLKREHHGYC
jgi:hypothetical protein